MDPAPGTLPGRVQSSKKIPYTISGKKITKTGHPKKDLENFLAGSPERLFQSLYEPPFFTVNLDKRVGRDEKEPPGPVP